jgi:hypothetical protein
MHLKMNQRIPRLAFVFLASFKVVATSDSSISYSKGNT